MRGRDDNEVIVEEREDKLDRPWTPEEHYTFDSSTLKEGSTYSPISSSAYKPVDEDDPEQTYHTKAAAIIPWVLLGLFIGAAIAAIL